MRPDISPSVAAVQRLWEAFARDGVEAVVDLMGEDAEWAPYTADGQVLRGRDEVLAFFGARAATAGRLDVTPYSFEERGECVLVHGRVRESRPGRFAESQAWWVFEVRDGEVRRATAHRTRSAAEAAADACAAV